MILYRGTRTVLDAVAPEFLYLNAQSVFFTPYQEAAEFYGARGWICMYAFPDNMTMGRLQPHQGSTIGPPLRTNPIDYEIELSRDDFPALALVAMQRGGLGRILVAPNSLHKTT